jgi:hypothetical protein
MNSGGTASFWRRGSLLRFTCRMVLRTAVTFMSKSREILVKASSLAVAATQRGVLASWFPPAVCFTVLLCWSGGAQPRAAAPGGSNQVNQELTSKLQGHWIHSHEEDTGNQMVFRPSTYAFPRSRGRQEFKLGPGGSLQAVRPGPTDKRQSSSGTWSLEPGGILVVHPTGEAALRFSVVSVDSEKLVVNRP